MNRRRFNSIAASCRAFLTLIALCVPLIATVTINAAEWSANKTWMAATSDTLFVVGSSLGDESSLPINRFWVSTLRVDDDKFPLPQSTYRLQQTEGELKFVVADSEAIRLLYAELSMWRHSLDATPTIAELFARQSDLPPLAVAGDRGRQELWFLVESGGLLAEDTDSTTQPSSSPTSAKADTTLTLLHVKKGFWERIPVREDLAGADDYLLAARSGTLILFATRVNATVKATSLIDGSWKLTEPIDGSAKLTPLSAGFSNDTPCVVLGSMNAEAGASEIRIAIRADESWSLLSPIREGTELLQLLPAAASLTVLNEKIAIARPRADGRIDFGVAKIADDAVVQFAPLSNLVEKPASESTSIAAVIRTLLALGITFGVWLSRANQIQKPATLPKGFMPAPIWKRGFATIIDVALPLFVCMGLMAVFEPVLLQRLQPIDMEDPDIQARWEVWGIVFAVVYGLWCMLWEMLGHATMGKRVVNCRVLSVHGVAATGRQLFIRNVFRIVMLSLGPSGLMTTFLMMLLITRNNQRVGDLAAETIVVQPIPPWMEESDLFMPGDDE